MAHAKQMGTVHAETSECEQLAQWSGAVGWKTDYKQLGGGAFDSWFNLNVSRPLRVTDQYSNRETAITGVPPEGYLPLLCILNSGHRGFFQGRKLEAHQAFLICPESEAFYRTPEEMRMQSLNVPLLQLGAAFETLTQQDISSFTSVTRAITMAPDTESSLVKTIHQALHLTSAGTTSGIPMLSYLEIEETLIELFVNVLIGDSGPKVESPNQRNQIKHVRVARDYIESHLEQPLGITTLCKIAGVSPRTLAYAFRNVLDTTPKKFVQACRLRAVRRALQNQTSEQTTVADLITQFGFNHAGNFSADYQTHFGEYPSATLFHAKNRLNRKT